MANEWWANDPVAPTAGGAQAPNEWWSNDPLIGDSQAMTAPTAPKPDFAQQLADVEEQIAAGFQPGEAGQGFIQGSLDLAQDTASSIAGSSVARAGGTQSEVEGRVGPGAMGRGLSTSQKIGQLPGAALDIMTGGRGNKFLNDMDLGQYGPGTPDTPSGRLGENLAPAGPVLIGGAPAGLRAAGKGLRKGASAVRDFNRDRKAYKALTTPKKTDEASAAMQKYVDAPITSREASEKAFGEADNLLLQARELAATGGRRGPRLSSADRLLQQGSLTLPRRGAEAQSGMRVIRDQARRAQDLHRTGGPAPKLSDDILQKLDGGEMTLDEFFELSREADSLAHPLAHKLSSALPESMRIAFRNDRQLGVAMQKVLAAGAERLPTAARASLKAAKAARLQALKYNQRESFFQLGATQSETGAMVVNPEAMFRGIKALEPAERAAIFGKEMDKAMNVMKRATKGTPAFQRAKRAVVSTVWKGVKAMATGAMWSAVPGLGYFYSQMD